MLAGRHLRRKGDSPGRESAPLDARADALTSPSRALTLRPRALTLRAHSLARVGLVAKHSPRDLEDVGLVPHARADG